MGFIRSCLLLIICLAYCCLFAQSPPQPQTAGTQSTSAPSEEKSAEAARVHEQLKQKDGEYADAMAVYAQHRYVDAVPMLEKLAVKYPENPVVLESLGVSLINSETELKDPQLRKQQRARGRSLLAKVQQQGIEDDLLLYYLRVIPADGGTDKVFSNQKEVNDAMQEGERMFARGDYKAAIKSYTRAMLLDPNLYRAVLFIGDSYFADKQYGSACEWFSRATQLDPNTETAYRYWGDALVRMGKLDEARSRFIDAVVAEPYERQAWVGLKQWADAAKVQLMAPNINAPKRPEATQGSDGKVTIPIALNLGSDKKDGTASWSIYQLMSGGWQAGVFKQRFPNEKEYRHTLVEESSSLGAVVSAVQEDLKKRKLKTKDLDPGIALLLKLSDSGMLEPHILINRADAGIAQDYAAYRDKNRDKLRQYLDEYVVPKTPTN